MQRLLLLFPMAALALLSWGQDLTHEVEADTIKWPVPVIDDAWQLTYLPHNNPNKNVYVYKDKLYDGLFTRNLGWNGGDGVQTTLLPDGNLFWTFNDSFYGVVNASTRARGTCDFPRNSIMVQTIDEETGRLGESDDHFIWLADWINITDPNASGYYQCRTHIRHPKATLTDEEIEAGEIDGYYLYWAGDATVYDGKLQMMWAGVNTGAEDPEPTDNRCLAIYSLEGEPGDGQYLSMESVDHYFREHDPLGYGSTLWEDEDGHTYLYANHQWLANEGDLLNTSSPIVARSETHDLRSPWEYYIADENGNFSWQSDYPTTEEANRSAISSRSVSMSWVFKEGDYYYMTAQEFVYGKRLYIMRSKNPWGPFEECHQLWIFPNVLDKQGTATYQNLYMIHLHQALSREGELVFSTNTDCADFWDNFNAVGSADFYRPYFIRVYNWKAVFDD